MARVLSPLGFRSVKPGKCSACGFDDGWRADGRGTVFCECQACSECGEFDGHAHSCPELASDDSDPAGDDGYDSDYSDCP